MIKIIIVINFHDLPQISEPQKDYSGPLAYYDNSLDPEFSNLTGNDSAVPIPRPIKVFPVQ